MRPEPLRRAPPAPDPDLADVRAAQTERAAFGALYRRYVDGVYRYSFYLLGDHHEAEDVTERTFLAALAALERFRDEGATFRAWLFRIAHNEIANALRRRGRHRTAPLDALPEPLVDDDPARHVARAEEGRRVRRALAALPDVRRQVVILRFVDGLSAAEIGAVLGRSEGAVRVLQHRALRQMARLLAG